MEVVKTIILSDEERQIVERARRSLGIAFPVEWDEEEVPSVATSKGRARRAKALGPESNEAKQRALANLMDQLPREQLEYGQKVFGQLLATLMRESEPAYWVRMGTTDGFGPPPGHMVKALTEARSQQSADVLECLDVISAAIVAIDTGFIPEDRRTLREAEAL